jgi:hypothetical protein
MKPPSCRESPRPDYQRHGAEDNDRPYANRRKYRLTMDELTVSTLAKTESSRRNAATVYRKKCGFTAPSRRPRMPGYSSRCSTISRKRDASRTAWPPASLLK